MLIVSDALIIIGTSLNLLSSTTSQNGFRIRTSFHVRMNRTCVLSSFRFTRERCALCVYRTRRLDVRRTTSKLRSSQSSTENPLLTRHKRDATSSSSCCDVDQQRHSLTTTMTPSDASWLTHHPSASSEVPDCAAAGLWLGGGGDPCCYLQYDVVDDENKLSCGTFHPAHSTLSAQTLPQPPTHTQVCFPSSLSTTYPN